jgi:hypothetical protein
MFTEHGYASHSPVSDGQRVYVFFGKTGALAFDLEGKQLWQKDLGTESGPMGWGTASSPILYKNLLIVTASAEGEALVALNKETGEQVWRKEAQGFSGTWGTPVLVDCGGGRTDLVLAVPREIWGFKRLLGQTPLTETDIDDILDYLCQAAAHQQVFYLWRPFLKDPEDDMVLELAVAANCGYVVTFNTRDFAGAEQFGIRIVTPREFLQLIGELP